jgi:heme-degrading monooxygenase HmoA
MDKYIKEKVVVHIFFDTASKFKQWRGDQPGHATPMVMKEKRN